MTILTVAPQAVQVAAGGGTSSHQLTNSGATRLAFKVKSSNNNEYRVNPVFGFVEPEASAALDIIRLAGPPKEDKMVVQFVEVPTDATDPQTPFKTGSPQGEVIIPVKAE